LALGHSSSNVCLSFVVSHIRSDNGHEFTARVVRRWLNQLGVKTMFSEQGSPWENGYIESSNGNLQDEFLNREIFMILEEAKVLIEQWRMEYNQVLPHSSLGYKPPAPEAILTGVMT
jgi:putative transposase